MGNLLFAASSGHGLVSVTSVLASLYPIVTIALARIVLQEHVAGSQRVGVLDADVYGHSIPHMLGVHQRPVVVDTMIVPSVRGDLKLMSIGFFLDDNAPVMNTHIAAP